MKPSDAHPYSSKAFQEILRKSFQEKVLPKVGCLRNFQKNSLYGLFRKCQLFRKLLV
jgi:hypothetical protein